MPIDKLRIMQQHLARANPVKPIFAVLKLSASRDGCHRNDGGTIYT